MELIPFMAILTGICIFQMAFISSGDILLHLVLLLGTVGKLLQQRVTLEDRIGNPIEPFHEETIISPVRCDL